MLEAIHEGYADLESLRRFTALGTGPCQGKACLAECVRLLAVHHGVDESAIGLMTLRPPVVPLPLGHLAALDAARLGSLFDTATQAKGERSASTVGGEIRTGRATPADVSRRTGRREGGT